MLLINNPFVIYEHKDAEYFCVRQVEGCRIIYDRFFGMWPRQRVTVRD